MSAAAAASFIIGTALGNATNVFFGATAATSFTVNGAGTQITAIAPAGTGAVNVTATSLYGTSNGLPFTYGNQPTITGLSPNQGLTSGTNTVTINGTGFTSTSTVLFGSSSLTPASVSPTQLTVTAPADTAGPKNVTVTNTFGTSNAATYTYGIAPTVSTVTPSSGPLAGNTSVTITGTDFTTNTTTVTFGGNAGTSVNVVSSTQLTVNTPAGSAGPVSVVVTTPFGNDSGSFTYVAPPTITAVAPASGTTAGGTSVTITGTNFTTPVTVTFDGTAGLNVVVQSSTSITVTTPAHAAGSVDVVVTTPGGTATRAAGYTFVTPPTASGLNPANGPSAGGTSVTITGTNLLTVSSVTFGGAEASIDSATSTTVTVTTPSRPAGGATVDVVVTTGGGTATLFGAYTFIDSPSILGVTPSTGPVAGGTVVTITGTNLLTASGVTFGGVAGTTLNVASDTELTITTPAHAAGSVAVSVTTVGGTTSSPTAYEYN